MINKKYQLFLDMDGIVADFNRGYKEAFFRDAYKDDPFTINQYCQQIPYFFRALPVIEKGRLLIDLLKEDGYKVVFITTPMPNMESCRRDKLEWIKSNFGEYDVIFSDKKSDYAEDESSILIDDMLHNLSGWANAGGTAIDFNKNSIDKIFEIIEEAIYGKKEIATVKEQLKHIDVAVPSEKEKEQGNYRKGLVKIKKMMISIENVPGSIRFGWDERGIKWINKIKDFYGYIKGTEGADYEHVDCFISPDYNNKNSIFVINQLKDGIFDEVKCMIGYINIEEAKKAYLRNYKSGWEKNIMSIIPTNTLKFREWLKLNSKDPFPE